VQALGFVRIEFSLDPAAGRASAEPSFEELQGTLVGSMDLVLRALAALLLCDLATLNGKPSLALIEHHIGQRLAAARAANRSQNSGEEISFRRGSFWYHRGDTIYNVQEADPVAKTLHGVRVFETTPEGRLVRSTRAEVVRVDEAHRWHLENATIRTFDLASPTRAPAVEKRVEAVLAVAAERDLALLDARAQTLSLGELHEYIRARAEDGRDTNRYREMLHARLADPVTVLAFALLAIPLGLAVERRLSLPGAAVFGIAALAVFYTARTTATVLVDSGLPGAALGPWFLLAALFAFGALAFYRAPQ